MVGPSYESFWHTDKDISDFREALENIDRDLDPQEIGETRVHVGRNGNHVIWEEEEHDNSCDYWEEEGHDNGCDYVVKIYSDRSDISLLEDVRGLMSASGVPEVENESILSDASDYISCYQR